MRSGDLGLTLGTEPDDSRNLSLPSSSFLFLLVSAELRSTEHATREQERGPQRDPRGGIRQFLVHELFKRAHFASDLGRSEGRIPAIWLRVQLYHVDLLFLGEGRTNTVGHPPPRPLVLGWLVQRDCVKWALYFTIPTEERSSLGEGEIKTERQVKVLSTQSVTSFLLRICIHQRVRTDNTRCS